MASQIKGLAQLQQNAGTRLIAAKVGEVDLNQT